MRRSPLCALALAAWLMTHPAVHAAGTAAAPTNTSGAATKPAAKSAKQPAATAAKAPTKTAAKPAAKTTSKTKRTAAKPAAAAPAVAAAPPAVDTPPIELTVEQAELASRVLLGDAACEFNQTIRVAAGQRLGEFTVTLGKTTYTLVPHATTTGAVRLEDARAGVVWLQIPTKSMLLNARVGQRMVDECKTEVQRTTVVAAGNTLGIVPPTVEQLAEAAAAVPVLATAPTSAPVTDAAGVAVVATSNMRTAWAEPVLAPADVASACEALIAQDLLGDLTGVQVADGAEPLSRASSATLVGSNTVAGCYLAPAPTLAGLSKLRTEPARGNAPASTVQGTAQTAAAVPAIAPAVAPAVAPVATPAAATAPAPAASAAPVATPTPPAPASIPASPAAPTPAAPASTATSQNTAQPASLQHGS